MEPVHCFYNPHGKEHTFHIGHPRQGEENKGAVFYAFREKALDTVPVYEWWNPKDKEHTFHAGDAWPNEEQGEIQFYAFSEAKADAEPVHNFWNGHAGEHTIHFDGPWHGEDKCSLQFYAFREPLHWKPEVDCDGIPAADRAKWLRENEGMAEDAAERRVMGEFPALFKGSAFHWQPQADCDGIPAADRAKWLRENEGMTEDAAQRRVMREFPAVFKAFVVHGKFPHSLSVVKDHHGKSRLRIAVTPHNPHEVSLVAVHYGIGHNKEDMNFDIKEPEPGTHTYVHVTPDFGPECHPGADVHYWLAGIVNGLIQEMPHGACPDGHRLHWKAH